MKYVRVGSTGLEVSAICLGCMSFGQPGRGRHPWTLDERRSREVIRHAVDLGVNFFDTANSYAEGTSEEILGRALRDFTDRDEIVIATKVYNRMRPGPNGAGLSRKAILAAIDHSLRRLGVDYVDLYQIHRWDLAAPIEETLQALHDVVQAGKARYIGASSMYSWQFAQALYLADQHGLTRFATMQNHYNLLYREEEREMLPLCLDQGIGVLPWSPLARGRLTRAWGERTERADTDEMGKHLYPQSDEAIVARVGDIAGRRGVPAAQIALAWLSSRPGVAAPIVGVTRMSHLDDADGALDITLTPDEIADLEAPYTPHPIAGMHQQRREIT